MSGTGAHPIAAEPGQIPTAQRLTPQISVSRWSRFEPRLKTEGSVERRPAQRAVEIGAGPARPECACMRDNCSGAFIVSRLANLSGRQCANRASWR